ncbi:hypothetical protein BDN72DRAFT_830053 [Pluteus cervinus]|uniref:Uncharacterized protein n=1 Tax=Pluteus cervinus TaxID=181527 RepID=A0ACD3BFR4_9AGAR|nr:hypothetical protein BDN72DRAFT_830053 [Pluteus cervinus]
MTSSAPSTLARRLLSPSKDLPPLLQSPNASPELNAELYDFIALALRAFVNPWWSKITRYDKEFLPDITRILTHVVHALEARALAIDLTPLVFHDIPVILASHFRDYHNVAEKISTSYAAGGAASLPVLFHHIQPHMALSPDGGIDREYYRQVVDVILKYCLPPEDYEPEAERYIVREIILKVLLDDVIPKISQPWFIQKVILDELGQEEEASHLFKPPSPSPTHNSFSISTLLVIILSAIQSFSGACLALAQAYKQTVSTIKRVNQTAQPATTANSIGSNPPDNQPKQSAASSYSNTPTSSVFSLPPIVPVEKPPPSNLTPPLIDLLAEIFTLHQRFASSILTTFLTITAAFFSPFLDRLLPYLLSSFLSPAFFLNTTRTAKRTLFPNGYPGPPPIDPTPEEQAHMHSQLVNWRPRGAIVYLFPWVFGPDPSATLGRALEPLSNQHCNMHLVVFLLDRILVALFPELIGERPKQETLPLTRTVSTS